MSTHLAKNRFTRQKINEKKRGVFHSWALKDYVQNKATVGAAIIVVWRKKNDNYSRNEKGEGDARVPGRSGP